MLKEIVDIAKCFYWGLTWRQGRYEFINWFICSIPGEYGIIIRRLLLRGFFKKAGINLALHPRVHIRGIHNLALGNNVQIGVDVFINANGGIEIGDDVLIGPGTKIWSVNHVYDNVEVPIIDQGYIDRRVIIESGVWIGTNCIVLPGVHITKGVIISAGSVVGAKPIEPYSLMAGNPARKIGSRLNKNKNSDAQPLVNV